MPRWLRSIPACAGEPTRQGGHPDGAEVYPRVCGGTPRPCCRGWSKSGLSPRVRGNQAGRNGNRTALRSIPACAGEPLAWQCPKRQKQVYPRVCGGTCPAFLGRNTECGLSPRVRGNPRWGSRRTDFPRSIPACAGEPMVPAQHVDDGGVYPRVRGGTHPTSPRCPAGGGLSPRVRGNPDDLQLQVVAEGSIPACAGEPAVSRSCLSCSPVYPRVCGGTVAFGEIGTGETGLSPRVRGNPGSWSA